MVDSHTMHENSIKTHGQLQNGQISPNQQKECNENAYKSKHEYVQNLKQDHLILPFLDVRVDDFDSGSSLVSLASDWNSYLVLKPTLMQFSVFTFSTKIAMFFFSFGRSFQVFCALGLHQYMYGIRLGLKFGSKTLCIDV